MLTVGTMNGKSQAVTSSARRAPARAAPARAAPARAASGGAGAVSRPMRTASSSVADRLLAWYDRHRRVLPWRAPAGQRPDPYRVWISEIMLQQTTVATAGPYFQRFLTGFPSVAALASAPVEDVMTAWSGL